MVKGINSKLLDSSKLRDLAASLAIVTAKSLELKPILESFLKPEMPQEFVQLDLKWKTEGGISVLERELATLQAALLDTRRRIKPALKTLKKSLQ